MLTWPGWVRQNKTQAVKLKKAVGKALRMQCKPYSFYLTGKFSLQGW
jgi:hypothetical protein